jgi:PAS domain S-box-containing protein
MTVLRILLIEDSEDDAVLVTRALKRSGFEIQYERVETPESVRSALENRTWDIIVSDFSMPHLRGTEALKLLRERDQDTPFIFVSGTIGEDAAVEAMRSGAQDYVLKENLTRLAPAIERELREAAERRARRFADARFRRVVDSAMIGILFWEPDGRISDANDQFLKVVGYTRDELNAGGLNWRDMTAPEFQAANLKSMQQVLDTGLCPPFEKAYVRKDGSHVPVIVGAALIDEEPTSTGVAFVLDITEGKRAAEALRASEERYRRLFKHHPHALALLDTNSLRFLEVNDATVRQYGFSRDEFLAMTVEDLDLPREEPTLRGQLHGAPAGFHAAGMWKHRKKDGTVIDVELTSNDLELFDRPTRLLSAVDVTEKRRAEVALHARERQQAAVAKLGQWAIETASIVELCERAVTIVTETLDVSFCGVLERQPDGKSLLLRSGIGWREGAVGQTKSDMATHGGFTIQTMEPVVVTDLRTESRFRRGDLLEEHDIVSGITVVIPGKDHAYGVLGAHSDRLREFTRDDIHFLQAVAHILGTVIDRERAEAISRQSQRMESVGRLAGGVAHDFNNLLTAIMGYGDLLFANAKSADVRDDIEEIRRAAERASSLTRQLLAFSRHQVLEPKPIALNGIIEDMEKLLRRLIAEHIDFQVRLQPELGTVKADPGQIEQVIVNLVVNARDAMSHGGRLVLETANVELDETYSDRDGAVEPGPFAMVSVTDTGMGMDRETRARIFEPFFTTKGPEEGTGLGLATVYGIVKQSGGHIFVYSEPGQGTTFKVYLPVVLDAVAEKTVPRVAVSLRGTATILVAEDEPTVRKLAARILQRAGYNVLTAENGAEALRISDQHEGTIHLLISDLVMPQISGGDLFRRLSASRPQLRVLYVSGYTDPSLVEEGLLDAGEEFLQKPFTVEGLERKVRAVLDR